jgi:hypothetical protein
LEHPVEVIRGPLALRQGDPLIVGVLPLAFEGLLEVCVGLGFGGQGLCGGLLFARDQDSAHRQTRQGQHYGRSHGRCGHQRRLVPPGYGNVATGYAGTVQLTSTDPQAQLEGAHTFTAADAGSYTFAVTLVTPGTWSIGASDGILFGSLNGIQVVGG